MDAFSKFLCFRPTIYAPKFHFVSKHTRSLRIQHSRPQTSTPSRQVSVYRTKAPMGYRQWSRTSSLGQLRRSRYASDMLKHMSVTERHSLEMRRTSYTPSQDRDSIWGLATQRRLRAASRRPSCTAAISVRRPPLTRACELIQSQFPRLTHRPRSVRPGTLL